MSSPIEIPEPGAPFPALAELSPARLAANRANAQLSTGPISDAGKAVSAQNRTTHGLARHNGEFRLLPHEDQAAFNALVAKLMTEHEPADEVEHILVSDLAKAQWLRERAQSLQHSCFDELMSQIEDPKLFSLYLRYETKHENSFHKTLNQLRKLREEKRKAQLGFEAQRVKTEQHEMKKDTHYWGVVKADAEAMQEIGRVALLKSAGVRENPAFLAQFEAELKNFGLKNGGLKLATAA